MNPIVDQRQAPSSNAAGTPISSHLSRILNRVLQWSESFVSGRYWMPKVTLFAIVFSIFFSGGFDLRGLKGGYDYSHETNYGYSEGYYQKIEHPFQDVARTAPKNSHDGNLNFRLTIPLILHVLGIRNHWILPVLTVSAVVVILALSPVIAFRITQDRICAFFVTLGIAATHVGSFGFISYFDALALAQLALAMLPGLNWLARGALVFTAAFTDERALIASGLLLVWQFCLPGRQGGRGWRAPGADFFSILAAMLLYGICRVLLMKVMGFASPNGGNGPGMFVLHIKFWHPVIWFSLEGGWLLVALASLALYHQQRLCALGFFMLAIAAMLGFGLMIGDVFRSVAYVFPAVFVALTVVRQNEETRILRLYCLAAFLISAIGGNYNVFIEKIYWFMPLPVQLLDKLGHYIYGLIRPMFPGSPA